MTVATDDFLRRTRALVSALGLLQRSEPDSVGYAEFRRKLEKSVRLVRDTADELLRAELAAAGLAHADVVQRAYESGLLTPEEAGRWRGYFDHVLPGDGAAYSEETLVRLRDFVLDARSLEAALRNT